MKYLTNDRNALYGATVTASNIQASTAVYRTALTRTGGGLVRLTGGYTGQADATFDVEVLNTTIVGVPRVSAPAFTGVGNGAMTAITAPSGMPAQVWTVTLIDLGTDTRRAYVPFGGVTLEARASGPDGNLITITVDETDLVATPTSFSLLEPLRAGSNEYVGQQWDFGAAVLNPNGTIPATAPRVRFGADPQVYRAYKYFREGQYVHAFAPAPVRDVSAGAIVSIVTGDRTVTVDDGTDTNTYTGITTQFSLLTAINGDPVGLLQVVEPVTNDLAPTGMGALDLSIQTNSFVASIERDGTTYVREAEINLTVGATSPTEVLTIRCVDAGIAGAERWTVAGTVSGAQVQAVTNVAYSQDGFSFTIPARLPPGESPIGTHLAVFKTSSRGDGEKVPSMCYENLVAGAEAQAKTYTFIWTQRPPTACKCDTRGIVGGPIDEYLGIDVPGGDTVATIPTALQSRAEDLYQWRSDFITANTAIAAPVSNEALPVAFGETVAPVTPGYASIVSERVSAVLTVDRVDIEAANTVASVFYGTLRRLFDEFDPAAIPTAATTEWDAAFTAMQADFDLIEGAVGAEFIRRANATVANPSGDGYQSQGPIAEQNIGRILIATLDQFIDRYRARMDLILTLAGVEPDFDDATRTGNGVWQDRGGDFWFASQDGLLPMFPGYYYHSARLVPNVIGVPVPVSTREFGIGIDIGCPELLQEGDRVEITLEPVANLRQTYQAGDTIQATIINGAPVQLGGGQNGDDTLTFSVVGSVDGALDNYGVLKTAPAAYLDGGLGFLIAPGGVPFALGDRFTFQVEGGQFRWRINGGSWSSTTQIAASVALSNGLSAAFEGGSAPSFVPGDSYSFRAEAAFGPAKSVVPTDDRIIWTGATVIDFTPTAALRPLREVLIFNHTIGNAATLRLQGSNDGFATTPYDQPIPWAAGTIQHVLPATILYDRYRITVSAAGSAQWIWVGEALEVSIPGGRREFGNLTKRRRLPGIARSAAQGVTIEHNALAQASVDALLTSLSHASAIDFGRLGVLPNDLEASAAIVALTADTIEIEDELDYQPRDTDKRLLRLALELAPTP